MPCRNIGIFAHVDAGKTTVSEQLLAYSGSILHGLPGQVCLSDRRPGKHEHIPARIQGVPR